MTDTALKNLGEHIASSLENDVLSFEVTLGVPERKERTADSGNLLATHFCGRCGSALYAINSARPRAFTIYAGTLDEPGSVEVDVFELCVVADALEGSSPGLSASVERLLRAHLLGLGFELKVPKESHQSRFLLRIATLPDDGFASHPGDRDAREYVRK